MQSMGRNVDEVLSCQAPLNTKPHWHQTSISCVDGASQYDEGLEEDSTLVDRQPQKQRMLNRLRQQAFLGASGDKSPYMNTQFAPAHN